MGLVTLELACLKLGAMEEFDDSIKNQVIFNFKHDSHWYVLWFLIIHVVVVVCLVSIEWG